MFAATRVVALGLVVLVASTSHAVAQEAADPFGEVAEQPVASPVRSALESPVPAEGLVFVDATLDEIAERIGELYNIRVRVDYQELGFIAIGKEDKHTLKVREGRLKSGLRQFLKQLDLTYIEADGELVITREEKASHFLAIKPQGGSPLQILSAAKPQAEGDAPTPVFYAEAHSQHTEKIRKVLREPLHSGGLEFSDTHLTEVIDFLRSEYAIEIQLDLKALDDLGMSPDDPVNVNLRNVSLGSALRLLLQPMDLTYVVSDEVLIITSEETECYRPFVAVYPVGDLLAGSSQKPEEIQRLIDVITGTVAADTWIVNGGPEGSVRAIQPGLLVISTTPDVHERIQQLLAALRRAKQHEFAVPHVDKPQDDMEQGGGGMF